MHTLQIANKDATLSSHAQEDVMMESAAPLIAVSTESVFTLQWTTSAKMETNVPSTNVPQRDVSTLQRIALMMMHVPRTCAMQPLESVSTPRSLANPALARLENATESWDAKFLTEFAMTTTHVLLTAVTRTLDAALFQMTSCVMITIQTPSIDVTLSRDVFTLQSTVTTTTHAPLMFVSTENANTSMHARLLTDALYQAVILQEDASTPQRTVMTTMHAPRTAATQQLDVSTL
jgi:hypothetical protein